MPIKVQYSLNSCKSVTIFRWHFPSMQWSMYTVGQKSLHCEYVIHKCQKKLILVIRLSVKPVVGYLLIYYIS